MDGTFITAGPSRFTNEEDNCEDRELRKELHLLVEKITKIGPTNDIVTQLKQLIKTSTTSMTSVPKPLKFLGGCHYDSLKDVYRHNNTHRALADVLSILSLARVTNDGCTRDMDCLNYCLEGNYDDIGQWGRDYIRQLEMEIVQQWHKTSSCQMSKLLMTLVRQVVTYDFKVHDEIAACDFLMEIGQITILNEPQYIDRDNYGIVCRYLGGCIHYLDNSEQESIQHLIYELYMKFTDFCNALIVALQLNCPRRIEGVLVAASDPLIVYQMAFICARQFCDVNTTKMSNLTEECQANVTSILANEQLSEYFQQFVRELDVLEPKLPEDIYKVWLEQQHLTRPLSGAPHHLLLAEKLDSARHNLASSFVNGFVNCAFGSDKLLTPSGGASGNKWIFRQKDLGMLSATAALGLLFLWDVDGGLTPIDRYLYASDGRIRAGALLALGIVNCRVRNECDPAFALLGEHVMGQEDDEDSCILQVGALFGIGLAYAGTARSDIIATLVPIIQTTRDIQILGVAALSCGLITVGRGGTTQEHDIASVLLEKILEIAVTDLVRSPYMLLAALGVGLCYLGRRSAIEVPNSIVQVLEEPFRTVFHIILKFCAYCGAGDVLIIQELLKTVEQSDMSTVSSSHVNCTATDTDSTNLIRRLQPSTKRHYEWHLNSGRALAVIGVAVVGMGGEQVGVEMLQRRLLTPLFCYGDVMVKRAVPLALALTAIGRPNNAIVIDILAKYGHDMDAEVAANACLGLGVVGAGSNHARLGVQLRHLAEYHTKNATQLFWVRIAQGLLHLGKGTLTLDPLHQGQQLLDPIAIAGILIHTVLMLLPHNWLVTKAHFLMYALVTAIQPRWLLTLDENLNMCAVNVRVGQPIDVLGKAGCPKTISGMRTLTTPLLLGGGERAELVGGDDMWSSVRAHLEGICLVENRNNSASIIS